MTDRIKLWYCIAVLLLSVGVQGHGIEYQRFSSRGKFGVRTTDGRTIIPAYYDGIGWSDGSFSVVEGVTGYQQDGKWGLVNMQNTLVTEAVYQRLTLHTDSRGKSGFTAQQLSGKTGVLNSKGETRIPFVYDDIRATGDRLILMVRRPDRWLFGLSDTDHTMIIPLEWAGIEPADRSLFGVTNFQKKTAIYTRDGQRTTEFIFDGIGPVSGKFLTVFSGTYTGVIGQDGKIIKYPAYKQAVPLPDGGLKLVRYDRWIALNRKLEEIRSVDADSIVPFERNFLRLVRGSRVGLVSYALKEWWAPEYDAIRRGPGSLWIIRKNQKIGLTKRDGTIVAEPRYDSTATLGQITAVVSGKGKYQRWQVLNLTTGKPDGQIYDRLESIPGFLRTQKNGFAGLADRQGNTLLEPVYDSVYMISGQVAAVRFLGKYGLIDLQGKWILLPQDNRPKLIGDNLYTLSSAGKHQLFSISGQLLLTSPFPLKRVGDEIHEIMNGTVIGRYSLSGTPVSGRADNRTGSFGNQMEKAEPPAPLFPVTEGLQGFQGNGKYGFRDTHGTLRIPNRYDSIVPFSEGLAAVKLNGRWGFLDSNDKLVFQPRFDLPSRFLDGVAPIRLHGKYGLLARDGFRLQPEYDELTPTPDGRFFILKKEGRYGLSDSGGTLLIEARYEYLLPVGQDQVIVKDRLYGVVSSRGMTMLPIAWENLWFLPEAEVFIGRQKGQEEIVYSRDK